MQKSEKTLEMENTSVLKIILRLSPPVMLALLIQSIYNIADSFFIAKYSASGLTALSIVYPVQLLITAVATGTGAGVNILISRLDGRGENGEQNNIIKSGFVLNFIHFVIFAVLGNIFAELYFSCCTGSFIVRTQGILYTRIVISGSLGIFIESVCTKILQARGNMLLPMVAQVAGSLSNIFLDIILIFGFWRIPALGIAGAAIATLIGQWIAMIITLIAVVRRYSFKGRFTLNSSIQIYKNGIGSIVTQSLYTFYIVGLNVILKGFTEDAVTVLGIYYKIQSFFFIPLLGFQQVLVPLISYNYGAGNEKRNKDILKCAIFVSTSIMLCATVIFMLFPDKLIGIFSSEYSIISIGKYALPVISVSFIFAGLTIVTTSYLQGIACIKISVFIIVLRQIFLLVPLAWILHFIGLKAVWWTFPITEIVAGLVGIFAISPYYQKRFCKE